MSEIKVTLGNESDLESYLRKVKFHDQKTLRTHWARIKSINRKSSNQWFLVLNRQSPFSSLVHSVPITILPLLSKTLPPIRWRVGTVFLPTPPNECLVFGEHVLPANEIGVLHSGDTIISKNEIVTQKNVPTVTKKGRGRPKGTAKNAKPQASISTATL